MTQPPSMLEGAIAGALEKCVTRGGVRAAGRSAWTFDLGNGKPLPVAARCEDRWLQLRAPIAGKEGADAPWRFLLLNGGLRGAARVVRAERERRMELRADLPLHDVELVSARLEAVCESLRRASAAVAGNEKDGDADAVSERAKDGKTELAWVQLALEHGWKLEPRESNRFAVELEAPGFLNQACVEQRGPEVRLSIDLARSDALSAQSRRAASLFLLTMTGWLRMVRGTATEREPGAIRLEVRLPAAMTGVELDLALAALSLACRLCTREVRALSDDLLARTYLDHTITEG